MPDRLITNNSTVAFEMLHRMRNRRKGKVGHMAIKLDISKANDMVECEFLKRSMVKLSFLVQMTVCTALYSILISGEPYDYITFAMVNLMVT